MKKKHFDISLFYNCVPQTTIIWCMVHEIWSSTKWFFCHFGPSQKIQILKKWKKTWRYHHFTLCTKNEDHMMYGSWDMERDRQNFLSFWAICCPFTPLTTKKSKFWKNEKKLEDIIILDLCTKNEDHMMYGSWDMERDRQNFLSFWAICCPFTPLTTKKSKFWKNEKKLEDIIILHLCTKNEDHMMYGSWDMERDRQNFLSFWVICGPFTLPPSNNPENKKVEKTKKTPRDIIILHMCTMNRDHMLYCSWDMVGDGGNFIFHFWLLFAVLPP